MSIKLVENTGYKYDPVYRFCGWEHAEDIRPVKTCGAETIGEFYLACLKAWSVETCSERFRPEWSAANPSVGQCTITAALVYEFFGGEVYSLPLDGGGRHSFNYINGRVRRPGQASSSAGTPCLNSPLPSLSTRRLSSQAGTRRSAAPCCVSTY